jgi:hypothetical protein
MTTRIDLRTLLTPDPHDILPHDMAFEGLRARLQEDKPDQRGRRPKLHKFASLSEEAARRTAVELNYLMLSNGDTPEPSEVAAELNEQARHLAGSLARVLEKMSGVAVGALTGVEDPDSPYEALPRGLASQALSNRDSKHFHVAFGPDLETLRKIDEREPSQFRNTTDRDQIKQLDQYDRAIYERAARAAILNPSLPWSERTDPHGAMARARYVKWGGPPARQVLIEPFVARLRALSALAENASKTFSSAMVGRGPRSSLASSAWQVEYAKVCWRCIQDQFGDAMACGLSAGPEGDFVQFIRVMAEYASGKRVESGFGGVVKKALAWGRQTSRAEKLQREFFNENSNSIPRT